MWKQDRDNKETMVTEPGDEPESSSVPSDQSGDISAFVGKGVEFKGTISYSGTVRIDGFLEGEIHTEGVLLIGDEAVIQAKVTAGTIVCKGKVTGDVVAKERVKLRAPAVFNGSMKTPVLSMEDGVLYNGGLEMSQGVREIAQGATFHAAANPATSNVKRISG